MRLYRAGEEIGKVFALDRGAGVAQVFLMSGQYMRVLVEQLNGTRRGHAIGADALRRELEARAGVSFNRWSEAA